MRTQPAVFLDRDDTLIDTHGVTAHSARPGDLWRADLVRLMPGVGPALRALRHAHFALVCCSSQGGVARGGYGLREVEAVNDRLRHLLHQAAGVTLDAVYYCPYHPRGVVAPFNTEHPWRKPGAGMVLAAAEELGLDLARSWSVGDMPRDAQAAVAAGIDPARALLIATTAAPGARCADLPAAADLILGARRDGARA